MATIEQIKTKVREFRSRTNFGKCEEDNFTPWWLQQKFKLSDEQATALCSDGNFDFGIDAFHIRDNQDTTILSLVQAKFTEDMKQITCGIKDVNRFIPKLSEILKGLESEDGSENIVVKRLRAKVGKIEITDKKPLEIDAFVICLSKSAPEFIEVQSLSSRNELVKKIETEIDNPNIIFNLKIIGLNELIENGVSNVVVSPKPFEIHFDGAEEVHMNGSVFMSGIGKLADMVRLYELKGNQLFDKNVRLFLYGKKNQILGPAGKIKETLNDINSGTKPTQKFVFLHNGITIYSTKVCYDKENRKIDITNPSILNGCQTIKASFFFFQEAISGANPKLNIDVWNNIPISIRIVVTMDDNLWREVAESNNRQNSMKASALRANDPIQLYLENEFKDLQIFYERQEKAFQNLSISEFDEIDNDYANSKKEPITIENLAQAIVCASDLPLSYATRQNEVFESHKLYQTVFSDNNIKNLKFLVFTHNIRRVIQSSIEKAIPERATFKYSGGFRNPNRYRDLFTRLVLKCIFKSEQFNLIDDYGDQVLTKKGKVSQQLIEELRSIIVSRDFPILSLVGDHYWDEQEEIWEKQDKQELLDLMVKKLKLTNIKVFEILKEL